jgi:D-alanyl-D-alanine carboxypeptidase (penicillin-binding protein 5/6)
MPAAARAPREATVSARAGILLDSRTGEVLWQRNADVPLPNASTTKVVTALVAIKSGRLEESLPVSVKAAETAPSKIGVKPGWRLRLHDLLYAILLNSANDASVVAAEGLGGSVEGFSRMMNAEALAAGAMNSHFVNPNGLPAENHYSTARDLTTLFAAALRYPVFREVLETKRAVIVPTAGRRRPIALRSHNRMLMGDYPIRVIGKTGWTLAAKKCFVGAATSGDRELLVAILGSRDLWGDLKKLVDGGFESDDQAPGLVAKEVDWDAAASTSFVATASGDDEDDARGPRYQVRLATFRQAGSAQRLRDSVTKSGYPATVQRSGRGKATRYLVTVGDFDSREQAQRTATKLRRTHHIKPIVERAA